MRVASCLRSLDGSPDGLPLLDMPDTGFHSSAPGLPGDPGPPPLAVCVFAHNEAPRIGRCLQSLAAALQGRRATPVMVIANGCTDDTAARAAAFSAPELDLRVVELTVGDKSNAWNHFAYELAPADTPALFLDGDVWIGVDTVRALVGRLTAEPDVHLVAAVPASGRNLETYRRQQAEQRSLWGNCYLAAAPFLEGIRQRRLKLPVGYIGDDGLLETMAKTDYLVTPWRVRNEAVAVEERAQFFFDSMQPGDVRKYVRRRIRYSLRAWQRLLLYRRLRERGGDALPPQVEVMYDQSVLALTPPLSPNWVFDYCALRMMRRAMPADGRQVSTGQEAP